MENFVNLFIKINTFYCYYRKRERNSYNTDDKKHFYSSLDVNNCITYTLCNMQFIIGAVDTYC